MTISLCTFVKNEENCIAHMIESVQNYVDEIIVVDTGSIDKTIEIAMACAIKPFAIHRMPFTNFGDIRTKCSHLATKDWILMLDADETLSNPERLKDCIEHANVSKIDAYSFSRFRWLDLEMTKQTELEAFPDPQVRFYRNNKAFEWKRELHEYFHGAAVFHANLGPSINHFHDVFKSPERLAERKKLYEELAVKAGVTVEGGHVL